MCEYCECGHYFAMEEEVDSRGQRTIVGASITNDMVCVDRKRISATGRNLGYAPLCYGKLRYCPMCGVALKEKVRT